MEVGFQKKEEKTLQKLQSPPPYPAHNIKGVKC
jgi:hypothetical protein